MDGYGLSLAKKRERAYAEIERQKKEAEAAEREARREQREIESNDAAKRSADASERSARSADRANVISVIALFFALASLVISVLKCQPPPPRRLKPQWPLRAGWRVGWLRPAPGIPLFELRTAHPASLRNTRPAPYSAIPGTPFPSSHHPPPVALLCVAILPPFLV